MATNKQATIRYHALDRCFSNSGRKFFIEDLIEACNDAIYQSTGSTNGVQRRQVFKDVSFMESEEGWSIPLEKRKEGRRVYYRYANPSFSIRGQGVNQAEVEQISETLAILSRFKGLQDFAWLDEIRVRLEDTFNTDTATTPAVSFEENPYLKGINYLAELFQSVSRQQPLSITYQGFNQKEPESFIFHPWYLKQYNSRWFVLGHNTRYDSLSTLAIDRIQELSPTPSQYIPNTIYDFDEYFEDVIGITIDFEKPVETILLQVAPSLWPYIASKPIHGSQKKKETTDSGTTIELQLRINYELISLLFSFMERVEVLEPQHLREEITQRLAAASLHY
jgi:predicted DNA-binding transcriptional regulator YafY